MFFSLFMRSKARTICLFSSNCVSLAFPHLWLPPLSLSPGTTTNTNESKMITGTTILGLLELTVTPGLEGGRRPAGRGREETNTTHIHHQSWSHHAQTAQPIPLASWPEAIGTVFFEERSSASDSLPGGTALRGDDCCREMCVPKEFRGPVSRKRAETMGSGLMTSWALIRIKDMLLQPGLFWDMPKRTARTATNCNRLPTQTTNNL